MSIADISGSSVTDLRSVPAERTPPQDLAAEQCVLGAILLSKDAIAEVVESVRENDFYKPAHQAIFSAAIDLYGRNEPVDAVTVADYLAKAGNLLRVGGAPYLHTLTASVPIAANAGYYARIVTEQAILRRLVEAGTRIAQMGYAAEGEVDQLVDRAQAEVYDVTGERSAEDYQPLENLMQGAIEEIEAIDSRGGQLVGVESAGTAGWHAGESADHRSQQALQRAGYDSDHVAQQFTQADFERFDLVLGMDYDNVRDLRGIAPDSLLAGNVRIFRSFDPALMHLPEDDPALETPDPYYGNASDFDAVLAMVEPAADGVVDHVRLEL